MGYYTRYTLTTINNSEYWQPEHDEAIKYISEQLEGYAINEDGTTSDSCKWYHHEDDMKKFSKKYPDIVFVLDGEGEDSGDIWRLYVKNGKIFKSFANIVFDEYDESKLK